MATTLTLGSAVAARYAFSNGNLTIASGATPNDSYVRSVATISSGNIYYFEMHVDVKGANDEAEIGWADATAAQTSYLGSDAHSIGYNVGSGNVYFNNAGATFGAPLVNYVMCACLNYTSTPKYYFRTITNLGVVGNWNNSGTVDPVTNTGGYSGMATPTTAAMSIDASGYQLTARFKFSDCTGTPPTGAIEVGPAASLSSSRAFIIGKPNENSIIVPRREVLLPESPRLYFPGYRPIPSIERRPV